MWQTTVLLFLGFSAACWATDSPAVAFRLRDSFLIVVSGSIGAMQQLAFVVDTGASCTVVDRRIAEALGSPTEPTDAFVLGQRQPAMRVEVADLKFGPLAVAKLSVLVMDLSRLSKAYRTRIDAIIGLDVLRHQSFTIDYHRKELRFGSTAPRGRNIALAPGYPRLAVEAQVNGKLLRLLVDSGADNLAVFADRLPRELRRRSSSYSRSTSAAGNKIASFLGHAELALGDIHLPNAPLYTFVGDSTVPYDGHIGLTVLARRWVYLDFENGKLWCED